MSEVVSFPGERSVPEPEAAQTVAAGQLRAFIERIERLDEDARALNEDRKEVYAEAKGSGFDTKAMKTIIAMRRKDPDQRHEEEAMVELYKAALGMN
ncbi:DUF2312 domain-containing protein [Mesorhizobium sp. Z1-4]|uniref:DUF2312 domain-containing protein n=1 Tax=Mesorhizobium sp. Z1-4 TaxID=2448478 RepID=UPI000FDB6CC7|nr:DUF2312 domain-containing protein [Mesorhizobium sp. Z1-4]